MQASPRGWRAARDEHAVYRRALAQAGALTTFGGKPLVVVSSTESLDGTRGWRDAQAELARLSTNTSARTVESAHAGVITEEPAAQQASGAILDTADSVRTGTPLLSAS